MTGGSPSLDTLLLAANRFPSPDNPSPVLLTFTPWQRPPDLGVMNRTRGKFVSFCPLTSCSHRQFAHLFEGGHIPWHAVTVQCHAVWTQNGHP